MYSKQKVPTMKSPPKSASFAEVCNSKKIEKIKNNISSDHIKRKKETGGKSVTIWLVHWKVNIPREYTTAQGSWASCTTSANAMPYADNIPAYLTQHNTITTFSYNVFLWPSYLLLTATNKFLQCSDAVIWMTWLKRKLACSLTAGWVKVGCVHLWQVTQCDPIRPLTSTLLSELEFH